MGTRKTEPAGKRRKGTERAALEDGSELSESASPGQQLIAEMVEQGKAYHPPGEPDERGASRPNKRVAVIPLDAESPGQAAETVQAPGRLPERKPEYAYRWNVDIAALPLDQQAAAWAQRIEWIKQHPDTKAKRRLEEYLQAANLDEAILQSPEITRFVSAMRDALHGHLPGEGMEHILLPLNTLQAQANGRSGGRQPTVDHDVVRRYHSRIKDQHDATSQTAARFGLTTRQVRNILQG